MQCGAVYRLPAPVTAANVQCEAVYRLPAAVTAANVQCGAVYRLPAAVTAAQMCRCAWRLILKALPDERLHCSFFYLLFNVALYSLALQPKLFCYLIFLVNIVIATVWYIYS